jgi:hypothetical protein
VACGFKRFRVSDPRGAISLDLVLLVEATGKEKETVIGVLVQPIMLASGSTLANMMNSTKREVKMLTRTIFQTRDAFAKAVEWIRI